MICAIRGCERRAWARGWCATHYSRWQRTGTTDLVRKAPEERFWEKVDRSDGTEACWIWTASRFHDGYGDFSCGVRRNHIRAHRFAWELTHGSIPAEMLILHSCDNPPCVNPAHLRLGTPAENMADRSRRGRVRNQHTGRLPRQNGYRCPDA